MIVVGGASGRLGRRTVSFLLERVDAARVVALSRTPEKIADLGVATRPADFNDPNGLVRAFDWAERLLLISTDVPGPGRIQQHTNAVRAAAEAGVGHVLYTSMVRAGEPDNPAVIAVDHRETERALAESGLTHTLLRESLYCEMTLFTAPGAVASGVLASNRGDGATGYVAREDVAAVAAALLADGGHEGELLDVTGPAAATDSEIAAILTEVTGRPVRYQPLTDDEAIAGMVERGMPEPVARSSASFGKAAREGWLDVVSDVVERIGGREPTSVAGFLAANRTALVAT
ncbi:MAG: NAD(P)H-binding protein [Streptosporangiales bacterium]|nr:NAD(P)H-binding protein [Streptosporangiales bacterium]